MAFTIRRRPSRQTEAPHIPAPRDPMNMPADRGWLPIGGVILIALCGLVVGPGGLLAVRPHPSALLQDNVATATSVLESAPASDLAAPAPTLASAAAPSMVPSAATSAAGNPWAVDIPSAVCIPADLPQTGRIVDIIDGRTIKVLMDADARAYSVRYIGLVVPSQGSLDFGAEASRRNTELVFHKHATLVRDITDTDPGGTLLRYVMVDNIFVNYELVAGGFAKTAPLAPDTACQVTLQAAEDAARSRGIGLWSQPLPTP